MRNIKSLELCQWLVQSGLGMVFATSKEVLDVILDDLLDKQSLEWDVINEDEPLTTL